ncbi:MAG TPA: nucleotidyl transferase AbiEii/AbiGii toxin family protein [Pseudomonadales bacterium]
MKFDGNSPYYQQVALLVQVLPFLAAHPCFALKGGTAINLFVQPFPRLSVDIDLTYLPQEERAVALSHIAEELERLAATVEQRLPGVSVKRDMPRGKLLIGNGRAEIKVEVSLSMRGSILPAKQAEMVEPAAELFGFASVQMLDARELYAGKLVAALDRQHPRDLFDVKNLLDQGLLNEALLELFLVYVLSSGRSIADILVPNFQDIENLYNNHFSGMTTTDVSLGELLQARDAMVATIHRLLKDEHKRFLLSIKAGQPDWELFAYPEAAKLPAVKFKLMNIERMSEEKRSASLEKLERVLYGVAP